MPAYPPAADSGRQDTEDAVLLYGHLDKQPEFTGWADGLSPWEPVIRDGKLYGRGGADDGYAVFASLAAIRALQEQGVPHARCVVLIEACEESGSVDLPHYVEALGSRLGTPSLVVCLDAGCGNYEQLWCTTSLRGGVIGSLSVDVLTEGVHSGLGTGIAPSAFRILRELLSRLENEVTGDLLIDEAYSTIPKERLEQAEAAAAALGDQTFNALPFLDGVQPLSNSPVELLLNNTWRPSLAVTGADGLPSVQDGGNVLLPRVTVKLSIRLAPTADPATATAAIKKTLEEDPPYGAHVCFEPSMGGAGWDAPATAPWLTEAMQRASRVVFGHDAIYMGTGGGIPFIGMLARRFRADAVPDNGRTGAEFERPRTQRVPAPRLCPQADGVRRLGTRRSPSAASDLTAVSGAATTGLGVAISRSRAHSSAQEPAGDGSSVRSASGNSSPSESSMTTRFGRPLGKLPRAVKTMRPSTGTLPATCRTTASRS